MKTRYTAYEVFKIFYSSRNKGVIDITKRQTTWKMIQNGKEPNYPSVKQMENYSDLYTKSTKEKWLEYHKLL